MSGHATCACLPAAGQALLVVCSRTQTYTPRLNHLLKFR